MTSMPPPGPDPVAAAAAWLAEKLPQASQAASSALTRLARGVGTLAAKLSTLLQKVGDK